MREYFKNKPDETTPLTGDRLNGLLNGEESVEKLVVGDIDGKNLLKNIAKSKTQNGVTFTVNNDGTVRVKGTATENTFLRVADGDWILEPGMYTLSGGYVNNETYVVLSAMHSDGTMFSHACRSSGWREFEIVEGDVVRFVQIRVGGGTTLDFTFKPQIEKGNVFTGFSPCKKIGYNEKDSMGKIVVDDISGKNLFNLYELGKNFSTITNNTEHEIDTTGIKLTAKKDSDGMLFSQHVILDARGLEGQELTISWKTECGRSDGYYPTAFELYYYNTEGDRELLSWGPDSGETIRIKDNLYDKPYIGAVFFLNLEGHQIKKGEYIRYYDIQLEKGRNKTQHVPHKKVSYDTVNSMGNIVVDNITTPNVLNTEKIFGAFKTAENKYTFGIDNFYYNVVSGTPEYFGLKRGQTYVFSMEILQNSNNLDNISAIVAYNETEAIYERTSNAVVTGFQFITFCLPSETIRIEIRTNRYNAIKTNTLVATNIQINRGNSETDIQSYVPHKSFGYINGKNAYGSWVKYDDGRLECLGTQIIPANENGAYWNFPHAFVNTDYEVSVTSIYQSNQPASARLVNCVTKTDNTRMYIYNWMADSTIPNYERRVSVMVKGYWK